MALKIPVKVNNVNNLTDARYCAGMGVSMMGFYLDSNVAGAITPQKVNEITSWISGIEKVGEFEVTELNQIIEIARNLELDYIQLNSLDYKINNIDIPVIQKLIVDRNNLSNITNIIREYTPLVSYFLIEGDDLEIFEIASNIAEWQTIAPIILGLGVQPANLTLILNDIRPAGISINGGNEIRPGYKDLDQLIDILEALEVED